MTQRTADLRYDGNGRGDSSDVLARADAVLIGSTAGRIATAEEYLSRKPAPMDPIVDGIFERGDKVALIGQSKTRKTFATIQLALCLATGRFWLDYELPRVRNVGIVQLELKAEHYHRRVRNVAHAMKIQAAGVAGRIAIANVRGARFRPGELIPAELMNGLHDQLAGEIDLLIIDPLYKLLAMQGASENDSTEIGRVLRQIDWLIEDTGAAVLYVHHSAKGHAGDRQAIDRGAGSGAIARDFDAGLFLGPHATEPDAVVVEAICRNFPSPAAFSARWDGYFHRDDVLPPQVATSQTAKAAMKQTAEDDVRLVSTCLDDLFGNDERVRVSDFQGRVAKKLNAGQHRARKIAQLLEDDGYVVRERAGRQEYLTRSNDEDSGEPEESDN